MASQSRSRRTASSAKATSSGGKSRPPSPNKSKTGRTRGSSGRRKATPKAKPNTKASPQPKAARRDKGSSNAKKTRGESRTAEMPHRTALLGRYQTSNFSTDVLDEIRQDIAGLRSDVQGLRDKCWDANHEAAFTTLFHREARKFRRLLLRELSGGKRDEQRDGEKAAEVTPPNGARFPQGPISDETEAVVGAHDSDKQLDCTPLFKHAHADYELLKQQTKLVPLADKKVKQLTQKSIETLLLELLVARSQAVVLLAASSTLDPRTFREVRKWLYDNEHISAIIQPITTKMHANHGGEEQVREKFLNVRLTESGVGLAQHIHSLGLPHLKHFGRNGNKVEAMNAATGSTDGPKEET